MMSAFWEGESSRHIVERIIVEGNFVAEAPLHLGSGGKIRESDAPLLRDLETGKPLLTGASLAGALRNYLVQLESGYQQSPLKNGYNARLLGGTRSDDKGLQSPLIIWDAIGEGATGEREGVKLDAVSHTAQDKTLFTFETWHTGTTFRLHFELLIYEQPEEETLALRVAFYTILQALGTGEIALGGRKNRGYGRGRVHQWYLRRFKTAITADLVAWLSYDQTPLTGTYISNNLAGDLDVTYALEDLRQEFHIRASFQLPNSLLIRTYVNVGDLAPDAVHLTENGRKILSGTSLAGAWRARAQKILNSFGGNVGIQAMFGFANEISHADSRASRVLFRETILQNSDVDLIQTRIKIDRFTGGVIEGALFDEQPAWGGEHVLCEIDIRLLNPTEAETGLMLLVLKDLWTADLPLGGTSSIGRGRLRGCEATLRCGDQAWQIDSTGRITTYEVNGNGYPAADGAAELQRYVNALWGIAV